MTSMISSVSKSEDLSELLRRAGGGDGPAFRLLHALVAKRLLPVALRIVRSRHLAEEVLQESFIAIWRDAARFDASRAAAMTWMITIVRNKAIDCLRANALREHLTDHEQAELPGTWADPAAGPCEMVEQAQRSRDIHDGLTALGQLPRRAIELAFFHDMTHDEVSLNMTIPLGTVKTWIRRGCQQIRVHLERPRFLTASAAMVPAVLLQQSLQRHVAR